MPSSPYTFDAKIWLYPGEAAWHFISVPQELSAQIRLLYGAEARGWGSLPVTVTIGSSTWQTSIFPDKKSSTYLLPLKAAVRKAQQLRAGMTATVTLTVRT